MATDTQEANQQSTDDFKEEPDFGIPYEMSSGIEKVLYDADSSDSSKSGQQNDSTVSIAIITLLQHEQYNITRYYIINILMKACFTDTTNNYYKRKWTLPGCKSACVCIS